MSWGRIGWPVCEIICTKSRTPDNEDEARSVTELTLSAGDYYSHDAVRSSRITVENGEMVIADIAQQHFHQRLENLRLFGYNVFCQSIASQRFDRNGIREHNQTV